MRLGSSIFLIVSGFALTIPGTEARKTYCPLGAQ